MTKKLTIDDSKNALADHVIDKAYRIREKYGNFIDYDTLCTILNDREIVRFPARIEFNSEPLEPGLFAIAEPVSENPQEGGYIIYVHEYFKDKLGNVPPLVLYHIVTVNYGEFATYKEAELFGSTALGMDQEYYYQLLCQLSDQVYQ